MAQNITINGENFQSVPSVVLPKTGGGSASFVDTTDATATSSEILEGYTAYGADGTKLTGTANGGVIIVEDTQDAAGGTIREITASETFVLQGNKSVTPSETAQTVTPDTGYDALTKVSVGAISSTYVGSDIARKSSSDLTASGATVTVPAGYYSSQASKTVASGSATTPATTITANPTISVSSGGLITATASTSQNVTPTVSAGYVSSGTAGKITVNGSNTQQLTVKAASTYNVNTSNQTIASGQYLTGTQTIRGVTTSNISAANIKSGVVVKVGDSADDDRITGVTGTFTAANTVSSGQTAAGASQILSGYSGFVDGAEVKGNIATKTSSNLTASGATVTVPAGYYASQATKSVATATHAKPTASINSSTGVVTASHTQAAGYVAAGTTTGTLNLTTQAAKTVTPTTSAQTAVVAGRYTTGAVTVAGDANLTAENIAEGVSIFGITGTHSGGGNLKPNVTVTPSSKVQIVTANETLLDISTSENIARMDSASSATATITTNIQWQSEPVVGTTYNVVVHCTVNGRDRTYDYDGTVVWNGYGSTLIDMHSSKGSGTPKGTFNETTFVIQHNDFNGDTNNNSPITIQMSAGNYDGLAQVTVEPVTKLFVNLTEGYDGSNSHYVSYKGTIYNNSGDCFVVCPKDTITIVGTNSQGVTISDVDSSETLISGTGTVTVDYEVKSHIWVSHNVYNSQSYINKYQFEPYLEVDLFGLSGVDTVDINIFTSIEPFDLEEAYDGFANTFINPVGVSGKSNYYYKDYSTNPEVEWECYIPANYYVFACITMNPIGSIPSSWLTSFRPLSSSEYEVKKVNGEFFTAIAFTYRHTVPSATFTIYEDVG